MQPAFAQVWQAAPMRPTFESETLEICLLNLISKELTLP